MVKTCIVRKEVVWVLETYENDLIALGDQLREKRKTANLSQDRLGDIVNISGKVISRYENGQTEMGVSTFLKFADALHTTPNDLAPERFHPASCLSTGGGELKSIEDLWTQLDERQRAVAYPTIMALLGSMLGQKKTG